MLWRRLPYRDRRAGADERQAHPVDRSTFIAKCHSIGLRVDFWTIDERDQASRLLELGADGIITNDPRILRPLFHPA